MTSLHPDLGGPRWTTADFLFTVVAGFASAFLVALLVAPVADAATVVVIALLGQYGGHLAGLGWVIRRRGSTFGALGLDVYASDGLYIIGGVLLQIALAVAALPVAERLGNDSSGQSLAETIPEISGLPLQVGLVAAITIIAPVTEELMFRGMLPRILMHRMGPVTAFGVAALIFALFHLLGVTPDEGFLASAALLLPQLFVVGLILGWQTRKRRRLGVAIFIHAGFNLVAVLSLLISPESFS